MTIGKKIRVDGQNVGVCVTEITRMTEDMKEYLEDIGGVNEVFMPGENFISLEHNDLSGIDGVIMNVEMK